MAGGAYSDGEGASAPAITWAAITPSDSTRLQPKPKVLFVGGAGTVVAVGPDGVSATFTCVAGQLLPIRPLYVNAASTATGIVALY